MLVEDTHASTEVELPDTIVDIVSRVRPISFCWLSRQIIVQGSAFSAATLCGFTRPFSYFFEASHILGTLQLCGPSFKKRTLNHQARFVEGISCLPSSVRLHDSVMLAKIHIAITPAQQGFLL